MTVTETSFDECLLNIEKLAAKSDVAGRLPVQEINELAQCGALRCVLPGEELDFNRPDFSADLLLLLKSVGRANLSIGRIFEGHINALYLIHLYGSDEQKQTWFTDVREHDALFGVWNTQPGKGVVFMQQNGQLTLSGHKIFCSGAGLVSRAIITGDIDMPEHKGWQMLVAGMHKISADKTDPSNWKTLGMRASCSFDVDFTGYHVEHEELLAKPGDYLNQPWFNGGAIRFAAVQLGGAEAVFEHTRNYLRSLGRMDDPFQKSRLTKMAAAITTGQLWIKQSAEYFDAWNHSPEDSDKLIAFANMTRMAIEEICIAVMDDSNRCVGARGLMFPFELERLHRDLTFYLRQPAPDAIRMDIAGFLTDQQNALMRSGFDKDLFLGQAVKADADFINQIKTYPTSVELSS